MNRNFSTSAIIEATRQWVTDFVVGLELCPFARRELDSNRIRITVTDAETEEQLLLALHQEMTYLSHHSDTETTLLVHPKTLREFSDYNQFLDYVDQLLEQQDLVGIYQVASFHPQYQFGGTGVDDPENYSNRSPFPMLHIIREESLEKALASYPDIETVPERNIALMNAMGGKKLAEQLARYLKPDDLTG
jgi:uncharacterized protein